MPTILISDLSQRNNLEEKLDSKKGGENWRQAGIVSTIHYALDDGKFDMSTQQGSGQTPVVWSNPGLDVAVKEFFRCVNTYISGL